MAERNSGIVIFLSNDSTLGPSVVFDQGQEGQEGQEDTAPPGIDRTFARDSFLCDSGSVLL